MSPRLMWLRTSLLRLATPDPPTPMPAAFVLASRMVESYPLSKHSLRRQALTLRAQVDAATRDAFAHRLAIEGVALARRAFARSVAIFWPVGTEPDTLLMAQALTYHEIIVALPCAGAMGEPLTFRGWKQGQALVEGAMRIPEPAPGARQVQPDLIFTPMTAFDRRGYRIGYGGGYYDATLAQIRASRSAPAIGIAFAAQEINRVPAEEHDQPLDLILTESELIDCSLAWR